MIEPDREHSSAPVAAMRIVEAMIVIGCLAAGLVTGLLYGVGWGLLTWAAAFAIAKRFLLPTAALLAFAWLTAGAEPFVLALTLAWFVWPPLQTVLVLWSRHVVRIYEEERAADGEKPNEAPAVPATHAPWRPRFVNATAVAVASLVVGFAAWSATVATPQRFDDRATIVQAARDLERGNLEVALVGFARVARRYPDSQLAILSLACPLWDAGYQDLAMLYYAGLLSFGFPYVQSPRGGCFVYRPTRVGIRIARLRGVLVPYVANADDPFEAKLLALLARVSAGSDSQWQAEHILACLNDRHDLRLLAGTNLVGAAASFEQEVSERGSPAPVVKLPAACLERFKTYSRVETPSGVTALPEDAEDRFFIPGRSPIPNPAGFAVENSRRG